MFCYVFCFFIKVGRKLFGIFMLFIKCVSFSVVLCCVLYWRSWCVEWLFNIVLLCWLSIIMLVLRWCIVCLIGGMSVLYLVFLCNLLLRCWWMYLCCFIILWWFNKSLWVVCSVFCFLLNCFVIFLIIR